jgi:thiol-disulfide isomerase/thioredoxin
MRPRGLRLLVAALALLLGTWAGLKVHTLHRSSDAGLRVPAGTASAPISADATATPQPVIPLKLPDFALNDIAGKSTPISTWQGKSLLINFWATWCAPCRQEIPLLKTLGADWSGRDFKVIGIAMDDPEKVKEFAGQFKIDYPVLIGEEDALEVAAKFGMPSPVFPFTVFTDQRGEVVALYVGELHRPQVDFILSQVQNLNRDRIQLSAARRSIADAMRTMAQKQAESTS